MSNYKQTTLTGESYQRCRLIEISNPYNQAPMVTFTEERITTLSSGEILKDQPTSPMRIPFYPEGRIAVYDPVTSLPTGTTVTMAEIYGVIYSAYLHYVLIRDNPQPTQYMNTEPPV